MRSKIILTDRKFISNQSYKKIFVFNHLISNYEKNVIFLSKYLDENPEIYKKKYFEFYDEIIFKVKKNLHKFQINKNYNNFTSSLFFEKSPFKTNIFLQLQVIVLRDLLKKEKNFEIEILIDDKALKFSIENLISNLFKKKYKKKIFIFKQEFNYYLSLFYSFFKILILTFNKKYYKSYIIKKNIFFSSHLKNYHPNEDTYWQNIFKILNDNAYTVFLLDYENFQNSKKSFKNVVYSSDFFKFNDLVIFFRNYFFTLKCNFQQSHLENIIIKSEFNFLYSLIYYDLKKSIKGSVFVENYFNSKSIFNFYKKIKKKNEKIKIFYPCEFHPHEIYINQSNKYIQTHGFIHSTLRYWLMNYFFSKKSYLFLKKLNFIPDIILVNGKKPFIEISKYLNKKNIKQVEALRHLNSFKIFHKKNNDKNLKRIFYGDIQSKSTLNMLNMIINNQKISTFTYKAHPLCKLNLDKNLYGKKMKFYDDKKISLNKFNLHLFGSTSFSLDYFLKNQKIVVFKDEANLNLSPLFFYVTQKFSDYKNYIVLKNSKFKKYSFFNLDPKLKLWRKILNN